MDARDRAAPYDAPVRLLARIVYWIAVLAVSLVLVIGLILFLESRDQSSVEGAGDAAPALSA